MSSNIPSTNEIDEALEKINYHKENLESVEELLEELVLEIGLDLEEIIRIIKTIPEEVVWMFYGSKGDGTPMIWNQRLIADITSKGIDQFKIFTPGDSSLDQFFELSGDARVGIKDVSPKGLTDQLDGSLNQLEVFLAVAESFKAHAFPIIETIFKSLISNPENINEETLNRIPKVWIITTPMYIFVAPIINYLRLVWGIDIHFIIDDPYYLCDTRVDLGKASSMIRPMPESLEKLISKPVNNVVEALFKKLFGRHAIKAFDEFAQKNGLKKHTKYNEKLISEFRLYDSELSMYHVLDPVAEPIYLEGGKIIMLPRAIPALISKEPKEEIKFCKENPNSDIYMVIGGATGSSEERQRNLVEVLNEVTKRDPNAAFIVVDDGKILEELKARIKDNLRIHITKGLVNIYGLSGYLTGVIHHGGSGTSSIMSTINFPNAPMYTIDEQHRNADKLFRNGSAIRPVKASLLNIKKDEKTKDIFDRKDFNRAVEGFMDILDQLNEKAQKIEVRSPQKIAEMINETFEIQRKATLRAILAIKCRVYNIEP